MKLEINPRLFWFLKEGTRLDLDDPANLEMYLQQVLACGTEEDVRNLLRAVDPGRFKQGFEKVKPFLPPEVQNFWADFLGNH